MDTITIVIDEFFYIWKNWGAVTSYPSINYTFLPCPPGFTFLETLGCDCLPQLKIMNTDCSINTLRESLTTWNAMSMWVGITDDTLGLGEQCPFDYCVHINMENTDLMQDLDQQCAFNRADKLCGGCKKSFSLAIGSSRCIRCNSKKSVALSIRK